ncbi:hypothetical protein [Polaromonas sp. CG9_12]|uniref:hypothetical protein n=1 Tax=Polaromonas sp. CG_9.11 TaxID=2787730 RepID=UPI0004DDDBCF|nr:hypothetical protein [Polaromonas sp. CG_9.11]MBG6077212.1 hypothetical protein [Polaromonas sp. CG_9.11]CDS50952.1 hypothetical protein [Polaromonas sp. CG9_12]
MTACRGVNSLFIDLNWLTLLDQQKIFSAEIQHKAFQIDTTNTLIQASFLASTPVAVVWQENSLPHGPGDGFSPLLRSASREGC